MAPSAALATGLAALLAVTPCVARAADDAGRTRIGFSAGMLFSVSSGFSTLPEEQQVAGGSFGLGVDFALGGFVTDQISLHWSGHGHYLFSDVSAVVAGLSGGRLTYYTKRAAPCWYASATLGRCWTQTLSGTEDSLVQGVGGSLAIGYELRREVCVEAEVFIGMDDPGDPSDDLEEHGSLVLVCLSIGSARYRQGSQAVS